MVKRLSLIFIFLFVASPVLPQELFEHLIVNGREAIVDRDYEKAHHFARQAMEIAPDDFRSLRLMGRVLGAKGKYKESLTHLRRALEIRPDDLDSLRAQCLVLFYSGSREKAWKELDAALKLHPEEASLYFNRAHFRTQNPDRKTGDLEAALADLTKATELDPDDPEIWYNRAWALTQLKRYTDAIEDQSKVVELRPNNAKDRFILGGLFANIGEKELAIEALEKAIKMSKEHDEDWIDSARELLRHLKR